MEGRIEDRIVARLSIQDAAEVIQKIHESRTLIRCAMAAIEDLLTKYDAALVPVPPDMALSQQQQLQQMQRHQQLLLQQRQQQQQQQQQVQNPAVYTVHSLSSDEDEDDPSEDVPAREE